jgi:hypothetical protein
MKRYTQWIGFIMLVFTLHSCVKENSFGPSQRKQILFFQLQGQTGNTNIVEDSLRVYITVGSNADVKKLKADSIRLSTFAKINPDPFTALDYTTPRVFTVTAEDGSTAMYAVIVRKEGSTPQLENSNFEAWYKPTGKNYFEPGADEQSIWASANAGVTTTGANNFNTSPITLPTNEKAAQLITKDLGSIAQITGQRMGSATLFTGKFILDLSNPINSTKFGIPFTARPTGFAVTAAYLAGTPYKDGRNNVLNKIDSADIYVLLENRENPNAIKRIATGWIRSGNTAPNTLVILQSNLVYGPLPANTPGYQFPANGLFGNANDPVTHITVVFSSSANGILYEGGVNSTLVVNTFTLQY